MCSWLKIFLFIICVSLIPQGVYGAKSKVLYVNSYHSDFPWSSGIIDGLLTTLNITQDAAGRIDDSDSEIQLRMFHMDTKRNAGEDYIRASALEVKGLIERWQPDVVITADDNAFKYLVVPYFRDSETPFVFCGMNGGISRYEGLPYSNTTGIVEISMSNQLVDHLSVYAKGTRLGFLSGDLYSDRAEVTFARNNYGIEFTKEYYVKTFEEWKHAFMSLQHEVDMFFWSAHSGIDGWNDKEALRVINKHASVPYGTVNEWMMPYELIGILKYPQEQGEWAAATALRIIGGESPSEIPIVTNKKAKIHLNMQIAKQLDIKLSIDLIKNAHLIGTKPKKLFYVNSYHKGYSWSDDVEKGLLKALEIHKNPDESYNISSSLVELKVFRMDTKRNKSVEYIEEATRQAREIIETWKPDIVVASDDNASKYLIMPYYKNSSLPFVFCGLNWDASVYGFPTRNITGMIEVGPVRETVKMLSSYAKGNRIGLIGANNLSNRKEIDHIQSFFALQEEDIKLMSDFEEWKQGYLYLQRTVDLMVLLHPIGIEGWSREQAEDFIMKNTTIPTGAVSDDYINLALLGNVKIAEEQGWWAGKTALKILQGTDPGDIPVTENKETRLYLNMKLAKKMGIHFPMELIEKATFLEEHKDQ